MTHTADRHISILLVEDEALISLAQKQSIERHGYEVAVVHSGEQAIEAVAADRDLELVLMDIDLGAGMDGVEAARRILEARELPVVFLTGHTEQEYVDRVKAVSSYGYVVKNSGEFVIMRSIEMAFELFGARTREKERKREYKQLLYSSEEPTASYDENGRILIMNNRAANDIGGVPEDFIGKSLSEILPKAQAERGLATLRHVFQTGESVRRESPVTIEGAERWFDMRFTPIRNDAGEIYAVLQMSTETTKTRKALEASYATEEKYRLLAEHSVDGILLVDRDLKPTYMSPAVERDSGRTVHDYVNRTTLDDMHPDDREELKSRLERAIREGEHSAEATHRVVTADGKVRWRRTRATLLYDDSGAFDGAVIVGEDMTERKRLEDELREREEKYRMLAENTVDVVFALDEKLQPTYVSPSVESLLGYPAEHLKDASISDFVEPEHKERVTERMREKIAAGETFGFTESAVVTAEGATRWVESRARYVYTKDGKLSAIIGSARDITDRKKAEEDLQAALEQKDQLMSELNHRVKNNLAMVASLISLKQSAMNDVVDLSDITNQINAIRAVHEKLQHSDDVSHIDAATYIEDVVRSTFCTGNGTDAQLELEIDDVSIPTKTATTLGLIVNELATNAVKHGFGSESRKRFSVTMETDEDSGEYVLTVSNNGAEFPPDIDLENTSSLGLQLLMALTGQLGGHLELQRSPSPVFTIRFPIPGEQHH
jgi:PAS domain S-box-containing protein